MARSMRQRAGMGMAVAMIGAVGKNPCDPRGVPDLLGALQRAALPGGDCYCCSPQLHRQPLPRQSHTHEPPSPVCSGSMRRALLAVGGAVGADVWQDRHLGRLPRFEQR